jgi:hypothetical protein
MELPRCHSGESDRFLIDLWDERSTSRQNPALARTKNISRLSSRQLNRVAAALSVGHRRKREAIIDEKRSLESAHTTFRRRAYQLPQTKG